MNLNNSFLDFDHAMVASGFKINRCDKCVYVMKTENDYVILCIYVDNMLILGSNIILCVYVDDILIFYSNHTSQICK